MFVVEKKVETEEERNKQPFSSCAESVSQQENIHKIKVGVLDQDKHTNLSNKSKYIRAEGKLSAGCEIKCSPNVTETNIVSADKVKQSYSGDNNTGRTYFINHLLCASPKS